MKRVLGLAPLILVVLLSGCLFSINQPLVLPDGSLALFLEADGSYSLFPEGGGLYLVRDDTWIAVPEAALSVTGSLLGVSVDGAELLYTNVQSDELFEPLRMTLHCVAAEPEAVPVRLLETDRWIAKAAWTREGEILLLFFGDEAAGTLERLDRATGELEVLQESVLSFEYHPENGTIDVLGIDRDGDLVAGTVERWDPTTNQRSELAVFMGTPPTIELYAMLPHALLWDASADGGWLAIALYDATMIEPLPEEEMPDLYLIDAEFEAVERIAVGGVMPAFSPDSKTLAYLTAATGVMDSETAVVRTRDLITGTETTVPGSLGVSTLLWLGPNRLGMVFEDDDERARLVEIDLSTNETIERIAAAAETAEESVDSL